VDLAAGGHGKIAFCGTITSRKLQWRGSAFEPGLLAKCETRGLLLTSMR